jgi:hypothetical protein
MSALRIITGMTVDEFPAPGPSPLPSTQPVEPVGRAQPCRAGMELFNMRPGGSSHCAGGDAAAPGALAGVQGRRFARAARNAANGPYGEQRGRGSVSEPFEQLGPHGGRGC